MNKKIKEIKDYFSLKQMKKEIYGYGYTISAIKYIIFTIIGAVLIFLVSLFYQINIGYIIPILLVYFACIPTLIRGKFINLYQKKRFNEVDIYLHQMIYSFQKNPKILNALKDTRKISTGKLKKVLSDAIDNMETSYSENILQESLGIIEKEYNNTRIKALNKFMINIELKGGNYQNSINIMLTDIDNWINRTYTEQIEIENVKISNIIGLCLGFVMGGVSVIFSKIFINSGYVDASKSISNDLMYQICSMVFLIISTIYFTYTQTGYNKDWVEKAKRDKTIMKDYKNATEFNPTKFRIKCIPIYIILGFITLIITLLDFIPYNKFIGMFLALIDVYMIISPTIIKKTAVDMTKKNIQDSFSEWLRDVSLNLQEKPLISAIQETYETCDIVLKPELELFLRRIEEDPTDVTPFYEFLARFHILDISAAIRNLYSLSEIEKDEMEEQLSLLIKRNYEIINKNEIDSSKDRNSALHFSEYIPVIIASGKIGVDMICLISIML